jgi:hypothetical protein
MWAAISTSWTTMPGNLLATSLVSERGKKYPGCYARQAQPEMATGEADGR